MNLRRPDDARPPPGAASPSALRSPATWAFFTLCMLVPALIARWAVGFAESGRVHGLSPIFFVLFTRLDVRASMWTLGGVAAALAICGRLDGARIACWVGDHVRALAAGVAMLLCAGTVFVYLDHPTAMDEYAQVFQSRIFAAGALAGHFPTAAMDWLVPPGFQNFFLTASKATGAVASGYWPAFALLMAPFTAIGMPWACNPVVSALTLVATHRLAWRLFGDREAAGWAVLFTLVSPEILANGISYYTMPAHLLANTVFALLLLEPTPRRLLLAGLVGSVALSLHNPVPHLLFALPWIVWTAARPGAVRRLGWLGLGYLPLSLALGVGWFVFTGHLRQAGQPAVVHGDALNGVWKLLSIFRLPGDDLLFARLVGLAKVWLWTVPGLVVLAGAGLWRGRHAAPQRVLAASALLTFLGYLVVPVDQGHGWGFRYFHTAWVALPVLAAGALARGAGSQRAGIFEDRQLRAFVAACALMTLAVDVPVRALQIHGFIADLVAQQPADPGSGRRILIIDTGHAFYGGDLVQNDPWLRGGVIRMMSHGPEADAAMMAAVFPRYRLVHAGARGSVWVEAAGAGH